MFKSNVIVSSLFLISTVFCCSKLQASGNNSTDYTNAKSIKDHVATVYSQVMSSWEEGDRPENYETGYLADMRATADMIEKQKNEEPRKE